MFRYSAHAERRMAARRIAAGEVEEAWAPSRRDGDRTGPAAPYGRGRCHPVDGGSGLRLKIVVPADDERFVITVADEDEEDRMAGMVVEYDTEAGAFYVRVAGRTVARTVEISTFVNIDLDVAGTVVGLELLCLPVAVTVEERGLLESRYPAALDALREVERLTRLSA